MSNPSLANCGYPATDYHTACRMMQPKLMELIDGKVKEINTIINTSESVREQIGNVIFDTQWLHKYLNYGDITSMPGYSKLLSTPVVMPTIQIEQIVMPTFGSNRKRAREEENISPRQEEIFMYPILSGFYNKDYHTITIGDLIKTRKQQLRNIRGYGIKLNHTKFYIGYFDAQGNFADGIYYRLSEQRHELCKITNGIISSNFQFTFECDYIYGCKTMTWDMYDKVINKPYR